MPSCVLSRSSATSSSVQREQHALHDCRVCTQRFSWAGRRQPSAIHKKLTVRIAHILLPPA